MRAIDTDTFKEFKSHIISNNQNDSQYFARFSSAYSFNTIQNGDKYTIFSLNPKIDQKNSYFIFESLNWTLSLFNSFQMPYKKTFDSKDKLLNLDSQTRKPPYQWVQKTETVTPKDTLSFIDLLTNEGSLLSMINQHKNSYGFTRIANSHAYGESSKITSATATLKTAFAQVLQIVDSMDNKLNNRANAFLILSWIFNNAGHFLTETDANYLNEVEQKILAVNSDESNNQPKSLSHYLTGLSLDSVLANQILVENIFGSLNTDGFNKIFAGFNMYQEDHIDLDAHSTDIVNTQKTNDIIYDQIVSGNYKNVIKSIIDNANKAAASNHLLTKISNNTANVNSPMLSDTAFINSHQNLMTSLSVTPDDPDLVKELLTELDRYIYGTLLSALNAQNHYLDALDLFSKTTSLSNINDKVNHIKNLPRGIQREKEILNLKTAELKRLSLTASLLSKFSESASRQLETMHTQSSEQWFDDFASQWSDIIFNSNADTKTDIDKTLNHLFDQTQHVNE